MVSVTMIWRFGKQGSKKVRLVPILLYRDLFFTSHCCTNGISGCEADSKGMTHIGSTSQFIDSKYSSEQAQPSLETT